MWNALEELLDVEADQFTFGTDDRFRIRAQAKPPSTRLFPFNTVCFLRGARGPFSGVLIAPRVVLTVKHALFSNIGAPSCGARLSTASTAAFAPVTVCPGLDGDQPAGQTTIARPQIQTVPVAAQFAHPRVDLGLVITPREFSMPRQFMLLQPRSDAQTVDRLVTLAGFPGDMPARTMWAHSDKVTSVSATHLFYRIDMCPGQSGGPVWLLGSAGTRILLGIQNAQVSSGVGAPGATNCGRAVSGTPLHNCGVRMTCDTIRWILDVCRRAGVRAPAVDGPTFKRCPRPAA
jgi:V8-like Glu-specific endopeptidase